MDTALIGSEAVDLLSRITGQKLSKEDLTPPVIFLSALVTELLGVIFADSQVTDEEKQRLQATLNKFIPTEGNVRQLTKLIVKGVLENLDYTKATQLLKLTKPLTKSEKLLLISFGYEMSAADGTMDAREKRYLEVIADWLGIKSSHLAVLEAGFSGQGNVNAAALDEVKSLLDPAHFHDLDTIFVKAANDILESLFPKSKPQETQQQQVASKPASNTQAAVSAQPEPQKTQQQRTTSYQQLQEFQKNRQQLQDFCSVIVKIFQDCNKKGFLPSTRTEDIEKVDKKLQSQNFRLAVVGEFSQGKSTLLNALLGEEIQPVRAIPCSGTVTVLKYGSRKRVVCRYKDGQEEEIPFDQYQQKAAISEEAALGSLRDEPNQIEEIIFEHPDLDLCGNGVEIVDSPGLNEHPERTAITQQLLKNTDAVIFLANASRPLTQGERDLLQDLKTQINGGKTDEPAENLFVVVNFMDLLRREQDRQGVRQRIERFVWGENIIKGANRVHYISAQAALDAILEAHDDDYLKDFQTFTKSIENFLTIERGSLEIKQVVKKINGLIESSLESLYQAKKILEGNLKLSETDKQKILEQIGEATGRDVRIRELSEQLRKQSIQQASSSWVEWKRGLVDRITEKSKQWKSNHSHIWSQKQLIQDYANQFNSELQREINSWANNQLKDKILKPNLKELDIEICKELEALQQGWKIIDKEIYTNVSQQLDFAVNEIDSNFGGASSLIGGILAGGALAARLLFFTGIGIIPAIIATVVTSIIGSFGVGMLDVDGIHNQIKQKLCEVGLNKFKESNNQISELLYQIVKSAFSSKVEAASEVIKQAMSLYENLLEQQEKAHKETVEQRQAEKAFIAQKRQELQQVQKDIEAILTQAA